MHERRERVARLHLDTRPEATLIGAISPEVEEANWKTSACPAEIMPPWLAGFLYRAHDEASKEGKGWLVRIVLDTLESWPTLSARRWRHVQRAVLQKAVEISLPHAGPARDVLERTLSLLCMTDREPSGEEWMLVASAAETSAEAAGEARAWKGLAVDRLILSLGNAIAKELAS